MTRKKALSKSLKKVVKTIRVMGEDTTNTIFYFTQEGLENAFKKLGWRFDEKEFILDRNNNFVENLSFIICKTYIM